MTLSAHRLYSSTLPPASASSGSSSSSGISTSSIRRGFAEVDDRVTLGTPGIVGVRCDSSVTAHAVAAHLARRASEHGFYTIFGWATRTAPLFVDITRKLGGSHIATDPRKCAEAISQLASARKAVIVAERPESGSWDASVIEELERARMGALFVFVSRGSTSTGEEEFDVGQELTSEDVSRWWRALAAAGQSRSETHDIAALEQWWSRTELNMPPRELPLAIPEHGKRLFQCLALADRAWPTTRLRDFGVSGSDLETLVQAGCVTIEHDFVWIKPSFASLAGQAIRDASDADRQFVVGVLNAQAQKDPWAQAQIAELLLANGDFAVAETNLASAVDRLEDASARRTLANRWMAAVSQLADEDAKIRLRISAAERALTNEDPEEAYRWAEAASRQTTDNAVVYLLLGRAAVAMGDLVAAKVVLEKALQHADGETETSVLSELAELSYLNGEFAPARELAMRVMATPSAIAANLTVRNTIGKILLAESKWAEADAHFTEDSLIASRHHATAEELRARLNRGISLLSQGRESEALLIFEAVMSDGEHKAVPRACGYALYNLAVIAVRQHAYGRALSLFERSLDVLGNRNRFITAALLGNLSELRRRLGLLEHAEHAIAFARRCFGPGMPPSRSGRIHLSSARIALARNDSAGARREALQGLRVYEQAGIREYVGEAHRIIARAALEDGEVAQAVEAVRASAEDCVTPEARTEGMLLTAAVARASGQPDLKLAIEALTAARAYGDEQFTIEAHTLLAELYKGDGDTASAREHLDEAIALRDRVARELPVATRSTYLARNDLRTLEQLRQLFADSEIIEDNAPRSQPGRALAQANGRRELVGEDPAIRALLLAIKRVGPVQSTVLVRGESGTGKELVAEAIHRASDRANGPLITVNCAALVETLLLSELFGHEKGAFTGAAVRRRGRFELAEGGTLFLDEIGDISPRTQVALLRVLQERTFERVGGSTPIRANVRIVCATHRDLRAMVERGEFREDLYYRLRGITLELPPLRMRMGDLPRISEALLTTIAEERDETVKTLSVDALDLLGRYRWPGNIRELENVLRATSLFAEGDVITAAHLVDNVDDLRALAQPYSRRTLPPPAAVPSITDLGADEDVAVTDDGEAELPSNEAAATTVAYAQVRQGAISLSDLKRQIERDCIARALAETKGNITRAASLLGMKRPRLSQLVKQYGLAAVSTEGA